MQEEEYTFVTLDNDQFLPADAVVVDVEGDGGDLFGAIMLDEGMESSDFITLLDDTIMLSDADMFDMDIVDMDSPDIAFML